MGKLLDAGANPGQQNFLTWAVRQRYVSIARRLLEAKAPPDGTAGRIPGPPHSPLSISDITLGVKLAADKNHLALLIQQHEKLDAIAFRLQLGGFMK